MHKDTRSPGTSTTSKSWVPPRMLGNEEEHSALLQAIIRELAAVETHLAKGPGKDSVDIAASGELVSRARLEIAHAVKHMKDAAVMPIDSSWTAGDSSCDRGDLETLQGAASLRSAAMRDRDMAEAELGVQRDERHALLKRLEDLAREQHLHRQEQNAECAAHEDREKQLEAECEAYEQGTQDLREQVLSQGRRIEAMNTVTRFFQFTKKTAQKKQARAAQEAYGAKLILQLKRITDAHLAKVQHEQQCIKDEIEEVKVQHEEKTEELKDKWAKRQSQHNIEVDALKQELTKLQESFEVQWAEGDRQLRQVLEDHERRSQTSLAELESQLVAQSEVLKGEAEQAQSEASVQQMDLAEVGDTYEREMKAQLEVKKHDIEVKCDLERKRFGRIRARNDAAADYLKQEAKMFHQGISYLRETYSGPHRRPRPPPPALPEQPMLTKPSPRSPYLTPLAQSIFDASEDWDG